MNDYMDERLFQKHLLEDEKRAKVAFTIISILLFFLLADATYLTFRPSSMNDSVKTLLVSPSPSIEVSPTSSITRAPSPTMPHVSTNNSVKDYFIPLGSGTGQSSTWQDVPGVQAVIDFGQYPSIKAVYFESSIYVPTANESVSLQLYNVTDNHPVWNSVVVTGTDATSYRTSSPLVYDTGAKLYQVQMQTQLQAPATLVQARIHIVLR